MIDTLIADIFTCCLTNPVRTALKWALERESCRLICPRVDINMMDKLPGEKKQRKTLLGELSWILTGVSEGIFLDCIIKSDDPRHDMKFYYECINTNSVLGSLMKNFVLATRIMRSYGCNPVSSFNGIQLPNTFHNHPLWKHWDAVVDETLIKLEENLIQDPQNPNTWQFNVDTVYGKTSFYQEQLNSFENWMRIPEERVGNVSLPPLYLPIGLQSILEIQPRKKALQLFSRYMDMCPSHIYNSITCGLNDLSTSYLHRLLSGLPYEQMEHESMVFCWTKLIAFQDRIAPTLFKKSPNRPFKQNRPRVQDWRPIEYFFSVLNDQDRQSETRAMATFIIARACETERLSAVGDDKSMHDIIYDYCFKVKREYISDDFVYELLNEKCKDPVLRKWILVLIGRMWDDHQECYKMSERCNYIETVIEFAKQDEDPEVRAAAIYAVGTYIGCTGEADEETNCKPAILNFASEVAQLINDACFVVRREIVYSIDLFLARYVDVMNQIRREFSKVQNRPSGPRGGPVTPQPALNSEKPIEPVDVLKKQLERFTMHPTSKIAEAIARLAMDPQIEVNRPAVSLFDRIFNPSRLMDDAPPGSPQMGASKVNIPTAVRHRKKSPFFKYSAQYWLRTQMTEQKTLDFVMQKKKQNLLAGRRLTVGVGRGRTLSRPRDRRSDKEFEYRYTVFLYIFLT